MPLPEEHPHFNLRKAHFAFVYRGTMDPECLRGIDAAVLMTVKGSNLTFAVLKLSKPKRMRQVYEAIKKWSNHNVSVESLPGQETPVVFALHNKQKHQITEVVVGQRHRIYDYKKELEARQREMELELQYLRGLHMMPS